MKKLLSGLRDGMTKGAACSYAGISDETMRQWGKADLGFLAQVEEAHLEAESRFTQVIAKAAFGHQVEKTITVTKANGDVEERVERYTEYDWQAARYWLGKRRREEWGEEEPKIAHQVNNFFLTAPPQLLIELAAKIEAMDAEYTVIEP